MTSTAIVKSSKAVKGSTSAVRSAFDAYDRAREIYLATIKRAEAEFFDRAKKALALSSGEEAHPPMPAEPAAAATTDQPQA